jgi:tetratricopeptide (TPR) repeat protein
MLLCGMAGLLVYLLLPLLVTLSDKVPVTFWEALKFNLAEAHEVLASIGKSIFNPAQYQQYVALVLAYLVPVLVMSIRWSATFGDNSRIGSGLASFFLHIVQAFFLMVFIWIAFDPQFSPRSLGSGVPLLTFYYLGALAIGYFTGYFLLIFGTEEILKRPPRKTPPLQKLNKPIVLCVWLLAAITVTGLIYRNTPLIRISNDDTLHQFAKLTEENLPHSGGYLLSDDPMRLFLIRSALAQDRRDNEYVPLDTSSLTAPSYHRFLHKHFPQKWPDLVSTNKAGSINPLGLMRFLAIISRTNDLYYLHPSFGYYFEVFYLEPHGLVYKMKTLPGDTLLPPQMDNNLISENENFWTRDAAPSLKKVEDAIAPPDPNAPLSTGEYLLMRLHVSRQANVKSATFVAGYYSRSLDYWGVQLQHADEFGRAATNFESAALFNPDNVVAQINLASNKKLEAGTPMTMDLSQVTLDQFGKYATWNEVLNANGPFDDPNYCFVYGANLVKDSYFRQSIGQFERVRELAPDYLPARLLLAEVYLMNHLPKNALAALRDPLENPARFSLNETNETSLNTFAAIAYFQETNSASGIKLIDTEIARHPDNNSVLATAAQIFIVRGLFTNAQAVVNHALKSRPDDPVWLYNKSVIAIHLKDYPLAIAILDHVLEIQTNNANALFNRALANLQSGRLDAAQTDYLRLQQSASNAPPIAYGLGEIARLKNETNDAVRYYQIYLSGVNTNSDEAKTIAARLKELKP